MVWSFVTHAATHAVLALSVFGKDRLDHRLDHYMGRGELETTISFVLLVVMT